MILKWNQQVFIYFILDMPIEEKWKKKQIKADTGTEG